VLTYNTFRHNLTQCFQVFRETGSVDRKKGNGRPTKRTEEAIAKVRQVMEEFPLTSRRRIIGPFFLTVKYHKNFLPKKGNDTNFFRNLDGCKVSGNHRAIS
jgi:hypothetical protein